MSVFKYIIWGLKGLKRGFNENKIKHQLKSTKHLECFYKKFSHTYIVRNKFLSVSYINNINVEKKKDKIIIILKKLLHAKTVI